MKVASAPFFPSHFYSDIKQIADENLRTKFLSWLGNKPVFFFNKETGSAVHFLRRKEQGLEINIGRSRGIKKHKIINKNKMSREGLYT